MCETSISPNAEQQQTIHCFSQGGWELVTGSSGLHSAGGRGGCACGGCHLSLSRPPSPELEKGVDHIHRSGSEREELKIKEPVQENSFYQDAMLPFKGDERVNLH